MQQDEIIQQKEWYDLTKDEEKQLEDLVSNEQEYNLLKKMLQVAATHSDTVSSVDPILHQRLLAQVNKQAPVKKLSVFKWQYIATVAILIGVGFAAISYLQKNKRDSKTLTVVAVNEKKILFTPQPTKDTIFAPISVINIAKMKLNARDTESKKRQKIYTELAPNDNIDLINTLVKEDPVLMNFITEVY